MKPSWQVTKLMLAYGARPLCSYRSLRAGQARGELADGAAVAFPEPADDVAILAVPLGPQHGKVADLIAAGADVPRLGDQLDLREDRVLMDDVEERAELD